MTSACFDRTVSELKQEGRGYYDTSLQFWSHRVGIETFAGSYGKDGEFVFWSHRVGIETSLACLQIVLLH